MLQPGTIILEKYRVERVLGKGGMGIVVAARHEHLGELFAVKTMLPVGLESPEAVERFLREARASARLKGEHVVRVHDVGNLDNGTPYMLMEYLDGEDLGGIVERRGALPVEEAVGYVHQACEAVIEAHSLGIVHRDLKPSNLFLTRRPNGSPCIKVLDFGISKEIDPEKKGMKLTKTGQFLGSPMYMSPEQMTDVKNTDVRSDIWSLGVILYELTTGIAPFMAETVPSVVTKVILSQPPVPSTVCPGLPLGLDTVIMRCLEKQPDGRYASVRELLAALEPFVTVASTTLERSGTYPRAILPSRPELVETALDVAIVLPNAAAQTLLDAPPEVSSPGPEIKSNGEQNRTIPLDLAAVLPGSTVQATPVAIAISTSSKNLATDDEAAQVLHATPKPQSNTKRNVWPWAVAGVLVSLGVAAFFVTHTTQETTAEQTASGAREKDSPSTSSAPQTPDVSSTNTSASGNTDTARQTASAALEPSAAPAPPNTKPTATEAKAGTSPTTKTKSPSGSTTRNGTTKKPPVRGYDD